MSIRDGATIVEHPRMSQVWEFYKILSNLYISKVRTPLYPWYFFAKLYYVPSAHFLLVEYKGEIIGGTVCVGLSNKTMYEWFVCGRDGEHKTIFPSELATYAGLSYSASNGFGKFDMMGAGKPDEHYGVRDFKARFGGELVEHGRFIKIFNRLQYKIGELGLSIKRYRNRGV